MRARLITLIVLLSLAPLGCSEDPDHLLEQARIALDNDRPDLAFEEVRKVLRQDRDHIPALLLRAEAHLHMEQYDESMRTIQRVESLDADNERAQELLVEWAVRRITFLLRSDVLPGSALESEFNEAVELADRQSRWLEQHGREAESLFLRARVNESRARRYYTLAEDPRAHLLRPDAPSPDDESHDPLRPGLLPGETIDDDFDDDALDDATDENPRDERQADRQNEPEDDTAPMLSRREYRELGDAQVEEALAFLERAFALDLRLFDASQMYVRLLVQQRQWERVWTVTEQLSEESELPAELANHLLIAMIAVPKEHRSHERIVELGTKLRGAVMPRDRDSLAYRISGARLLMLQENWEQARAILREIVEQRPHDYEASYMLALCAFRLEEFEEAERLLGPISNALSRSANVQALHGQTLLARGDAAGARRTLQHALMLDPYDTTAQMAYLLALVRLEAFEEAEPYITEFYAQQPDHPQAMMMMLQLEQWRGNRQAVRQLLTNIEEQESLTDAHLSLLISGYRFLGDFERVEQYADRVSEDHPGGFENQLTRAEALLAQGRTQEAGELLQRLASQQPDHPGVHLLLGRQRLVANDFPGALPLLEKAVEARPSDARARLMLAHALMGTGQFDASAGQIEESLRIEPRSMLGRDMAVRLYHMVDRNDRVAYHLSQVNLRNLNEADWPVLAAMGWLAQNQLDRAEHICREAIREERDEPLLRLVLSSVHERRGEIEQAQQQITRFLEGESRNLQAYRTFASFHLRNNLVEPAIAQLQAMEEDSPQAVRLTKASLYLETGRADRTIALLEPELDQLISDRSPMALMVAQTLARAQLRSNRPADAVATLDKLISAGVTTSEATLLAIDVLIATGQQSEARQRLESLAQRVDPGNHAVALEIIKRMVEQNMHRQALSRVDGWLTQRPQNAAMLTWKAELHTQLDELDQAVTAYQAAIQADPRQADPRRSLAALHLRRHDHPAAEAVLLRMGETGYEGQTQSLTAMAQLYTTIGLTQRATAALDQLERTASHDDADARLMLGRSLLQLGEDERAYEQLQRIAPTTPQYGAAQALMAQAELARGRVDDAGRRLRQVAQDPNHAAGTFSVFAALSPNDPNHHDLIRWFDAGLELEQLSVQQQQQWLMVRLFMHVRRGEWEQALDTAELFAQRLENPAAVNAVRFTLHLQLGRTEEARHIYDNFPQLAQSPSGALAAMLLDAPRPIGAAEPTDLGRFVIAMAQGDLSGARQFAQQLAPHQTIYRRDLQDAVERTPTDSASAMEGYRQFAIAMIAMDSGLLNMARRICMDIIEVEPTVAPAYGLLTLLGEPLPDNALPPSGIAYYNTAVTRRDEGDDKGALEAMHRLAQREPDNHFVRYLLGQAYERAGQFDQAIEQYRAVWQIDSSIRAQVGNNLAFLLAKERPDQLDEAHRIASQILADNLDMPARAYVLDTMGWIEHQRGNHQQALRHLQQAIEHLRAHPDVHRHLAAVYRAVNERGWADYHERQARLLEDRAAEIIP